MATLLNGLNAVFKRVGLIAGDSQELATLTDSARQHDVDIVVQAWNEAISELFTVSSRPLPKEQAESTITLATGDRSYALAADLVQMRWPLIDKTNNQYITQFPGGYNAILILDPEQDDTGLPHWAAISPVDGELYLDRAPTSVENGRVYTYQYDKDLTMDAAADVMPFSDAVYNALIPAVAEIWKRDRRKEVDGTYMNISIGRAARLLTQNQPRSDWSPR